MNANEGRSECRDRGVCRYTFVCSKEVCSGKGEENAGHGGQPVQNANVLLYPITQTMVGLFLHFNFLFDSNLG